MIKKNFRLLVVMLLIGVMILSMTGCTKSNEKEKDTNNNPTATYPMTIKDNVGNDVTIEKEPLKVISLAPSNTEILFAIEAGDKVIGVSGSCDYPEQALSVEKVADFQNLNIEGIVALDPDVIFAVDGWNSDDVEELRNLGLTIVTIKSQSIDEVIASIRLVGKVVNKSQKADVIAKEMENKKQEIVDKVKTIEEKVTVFYEVWYEPLMTVGGDEFIHELITLAGGINIAQDTKGFPMYDMEKLIEEDPVVYLIPEFNNTMSPVEQRPGFEGLQAIKNNKVYLTDNNLVSRPGPRIHLGLESIAKALYPELFE
jgi:iron complex transport system substrate-binding protein